MFNSESVDIVVSYDGDVEVGGGTYVAVFPGGSKKKVHAPARETLEKALVALLKVSGKAAAENPFSKDLFFSRGV